MNVVYNGWIGCPQPRDIVWLRPKDFAEGKTRFIKGGAAANDVVQGQIGDCWLVAAMSALASRDTLVRGFDKEVKLGPEGQITDQICDKMSKGAYPPLFHIYRRKGIYVIRIFKNMKWRYVIIGTNIFPYSFLLDPRMPCFAGSRKPVFGTCKNPDELWVNLIEKAMAKIHGYRFNFCHFF